jgi:large repetitive protein
MIRRILLIGALVAAAGSVALAPTAGAQNYGGCNATVSDTTPNPGQTVTVSGSGADADATVTASISGTEVGSGTADADGEFSFSVTVPATASGTVTLSVSGGANDGFDSVTLTVGSALLPATGSNDTLPMTRIALGALAIGGLVLAASRFRALKTSL